MIANAQRGARLQISTDGLELRTAEFDAAAAELLGEKASKTQVAEHLGIDKATLSLYRHQRRTPSRRFVETVLATFPDATFKRFFTYAGSNERGTA